jgi:glyoxylase-like metal-dependent hydrolase (beta-lactamase superfamily II)
LQLYFLNGSERGVLVDSGCAPDPEQVIFPDLGPRDLDLVINTHCDLDHCGGNHAVKIENPDMQIRCGEADRRLIEDPQTMWNLSYNAYDSEHGIHYDEANRKAIVHSLGEPQPVDWT